MLKINGQLTDKFMHQRGLRQGDPLSPLLFILVADVLQSFIFNANNLLTGPIIIPPKALQFADDTIILMEAQPRNLSIISSILSHFSKLSGLVINDNKSVFVSISIPSSRVHIVQNILGCPAKEFPITYLGLPLSINKPRRIHFLPLMEAMHQKLQGWKSKFLSLGGRLVLIKSVLAAIPLHYMQVFKMPSWLLNQIDRLCRAFLWKGVDTCFGGQCLVNWDTCCLPKNCGGLGILHLQSQNEALLTKWLWNLAANRDSQWSILIQNLYGSTDIDSLATHDKISYGLRDIMLSKQLLLSSIEHSSGDSAIRWKWTTNGQFSSKSLYSLLRDPGMRSSYHNILWKSKAPLKTKIFFWLAMLNRLLTRDNLFNKGWGIDRECALCQNANETAFHLFVQCPFANNIWECFLRLGVQLTVTDSLCDFWLHNRKCFKMCYKDNWDTIWIAGMWNIWKRRCAVIFETSTINIQETSRKAMQDASSWIKNC